VAVIDRAPRVEGHKEPGGVAPFERDLGDGGVRQRVVELAHRQAAHHTGWRPGGRVLQAQMLPRSRHGDPAAGRAFSRPRWRRNGS